MAIELTPMRWPNGWHDPAALALLKDSAVNCLLIDKDPALEPVANKARDIGIKVSEPTSPPPGIAIVPGEWAGLKTSRSDPADVTTAGPTGTPWVDSNGWRIRL